MNTLEVLTLLLVVFAALTLQITTITTKWLSPTAIGE